MNGDEVLLRERGVVVTKTRLLVAGRAYELAKISSVDQERGNSPIGIPQVAAVVLLIGLGVWLGLAGLEGPSFWRLGLAAILALSGLYIAYAASTPKHVLIVRLGEVRDEALTSSDAEFIRRVADAVTRAIESKE